MDSLVALVAVQGGLEILETEVTAVCSLVATETIDRDLKEVEELGSTEVLTQIGHGVGEEHVDDNGMDHVVKSLGVQNGPSAVKVGGHTES